MIKINKIIYSQYEWPFARIKKGKGNVGPDLKYNYRRVDSVQVPPRDPISGLDCQEWVKRRSISSEASDRGMKTIFYRQTRKGKSGLRSGRLSLSNSVRYRKMGHLRMHVTEFPYRQSQIGPLRSESSFLGQQSRTPPASYYQLYTHTVEKPALAHFGPRHGAPKVTARAADQWLATSGVASQGFPETGGGEGNRGFGMKGNKEK